MLLSQFSRRRLATLALVPALIVGLLAQPALAAAPASRARFARAAPLHRERQAVPVDAAA